VTTEILDRVLSEFGSLPRGRADPQLDAIEAALFLEDSLSLRLSDADMTPENLGGTERIERFARERVGS